MWKPLVDLGYRRTNRTDTFLKRAYEQYQNSDMDALWKAYSKPSVKKQQIWDNLRKFVQEQNLQGVPVTGLKITSLNKYGFSVGFIIKWGKDQFGREVCPQFYHLTPTGYYSVLELGDWERTETGAWRIVPRKL